jgi:hypothetical protein
MTIKTDRDDEMRVLAAVGVAGSGWSGVQERAQSMGLDERRFAAAARRLVTSGAIIQSGTGTQATLRRVLGAWVR